MALGLGIMRMTPAAFWAMTPRELAAAMRALSSAAGHVEPISREALSDLMHRFPDATT